MLDLDGKWLPKIPNNQYFLTHASKKAKGARQRFFLFGATYKNTLNFKYYLYLLLRF